MQVRRFVLVALLAALLAPVRPALALDCAISTPGERLVRAQVVIVGEAAAGSLLTRSGPVSVRVERVFKGDAPGMMQVMPSSWDPMLRGKRYLLFLKWDVAEGAWTPLLCGGTHTLAGDLAPEYAAALGPGYEANGLPQRPVPAWLPWAGGAALLMAGGWLLRMLAPAGRKG